ncbi:hypothetical protein M9Y10_035711 [Tritrichomonas musculus]|uniref:Protein kinase domain-containing protein n=1 Tax=Tritrichomonas musculus TaxID=1915356 RepID=A0ABR2GWH6_9EUKA
MSSTDQPRSNSDNDESHEDEYLLDIKNYKIKDQLSIELKSKEKNVNIVQDKTTKKLFMAKTIKEYSQPISISDEIYKLMQIDNPTIIQLKGVSYQDLQGDENITIITDYIENGLILSDLIMHQIESDCPLEYTNTKRQIILAGIAYGMMILHNHDIGHQDLKAENIFLDGEFQPHITDFWLSKIFNFNKSIENIDNKAYLAPETLQQKEPLFDKKTDVYSFGILMFEIISGTRAERNGGTPELNKITNDNLKKLIEECLSVNPDERPSFDDLFKKLSLNQTDTKVTSQECMKYSLDGVDIDELFLYVSDISTKEEEKFSKTKNICQKILSLYQNEKETETEFDENCKEFIETLVKQLPDKSKIQSVLSKIDSDSFVANTSRLYFFSVDEDNLKAILNRGDLFKIDSVFEVFSSYIFFTWISTTILLVRGRFKQDFIQLLYNLNFLIEETSEVPSREEYNKTAISCFVHIINVASENDNELSIFLSRDTILSVLTSIKQFMNISTTEDEFFGFLKPLMIHVLKFFHNNENKRESTKLSENQNLKKFIACDDFFYFHPPFDLYQIDKVFSLGTEPSFDVKELMNFIPQEMLPVVLTIEQIITKDEKNAESFILEIMEAFKFNNDNLESDSVETFYDQCVIVFYLMNSIMSHFPNLTIQTSNEKIFSGLVIKNIFDPNITYFTQNSYFEIVNSLRHFTFHFLLINDQMLLNIILQDISVYPDLLWESVFRLILIEKEDKNLNFSSIVDTLITDLLTYRLNSNQCITNEINFYLFIRKTLLTFFETFFTNENVIKQIFSSQIFLDSFLTLLYEPPIREKLIDYFTKYLISLDSEADFQQLNQKIVNMINTSISELKQNETLSFLSEIIKLLNQIISKNQSLINILKPITSELINFIMNIKISSDEKRANDELLLQIMTYLIFAYQHEIITTNNRSLLRSIIFRIFKTKSEKIMDRFIQTVPKLLSFVQPNFEMEQATDLCSFVCLFINTKYIYSVVKFISDLCSYSSENCRKCKEGRLDILIIDTINEWKKSIIKIIHEDDTDEVTLTFNENEIIVSEKLINLLLTLFCQIVSSVSSIPVVNKFFSALCPIDSNYLSLIHPNILKTLNNILIASYKLPAAEIPMLPSSEIQINNINSKIIKKGFSFVFWISIPSKMEGIIQNIIYLKDAQNHFFKMDLKERNLQITIQSRAFSYEEDFQLNIPTNTWTMITLTVIPNKDDNKSDITLFINNVKITINSKFPLFRPNDSIECFINKATNENQVNPPLMGLFLLSKPLIIDEISSLKNEGQRSLPSSCESKVIFAYTPIKSDKYISLLAIKQINEIKENQQKILPIKKPFSFTDLLVEYCKVSLVIPIFGELDILLKDGSQFQSQVFLCVEVLSNLFKFGEDSQQSFYTFNGFFAISHLLQNSSKSHISYDLYLSFFNLLENISFKNLQLQLIDAILMNIFIWSNSKIEEQSNVLSHWANKLYKNYKELIDLIRSFEWFLYAFRLYFHSFGCDIEIYSKCRMSLLQVATESFKAKLTEKHISIIMGMICSNESTSPEKKELLNFLSTILHSDKEITEAKIRVSKLIPYLISIFDLETKDGYIVSNVISLLVVIYKLKNYFISVPFDKVIQNIVISLYIKDNYIISEEFYILLISLMNSFKAVELLPILCINAILGGFKYLQLLLKKADRHLNYYNLQQSTIYPALLIYAFIKQNDLYKEIIKFVISLFKGYWIELIDAINAIGISCYDVGVADGIVHDVLLEIAKNQDARNGDVYLLIGIIKDFIFFKRELNQASTDEDESENNIEIAESLSVEPSDEFVDIDEDSQCSECDISIINPSHSRSLTDLLTFTKQQNNNNNNEQQKENMNRKESDSDDALDIIIANAGEYTCDSKIIDIIHNLSEILEDTFQSDFLSRKFNPGLRLDEGKNWIDLDLAKEAFRIINESSFNSEIKILFAYLINKYDILFAMQMDSFLDSLYPRLKIREEKITNFNNTYKKVLSQLNRKEISPQFVSFVNAIKFFYNSCLHDSSFEYKEKVEQLITDNFVIFNQFTNQIKITVASNKKIWSSLWSSLSVPQSPWSDSIRKNPKVEFKRINTFCYAYCPYKLQRIESITNNLPSPSSPTRNNLVSSKSLLFDQIRKKDSTSYESFNNLPFDIAKKAECKLLTIGVQKSASITIDDNSLSITKTKRNKTETILYDNIYLILYATNLFDCSTIKILTKARECYFLLFNNEMFENIISCIKKNIANDKKVRCMYPRASYSSFPHTDLWLNGKISNFQYLMSLNIISGRSFNDAEHYPVFPWILTDYDNSTLDLNNQLIYRDLSKPVGALNEQRLKELLNKSKETRNNSYLYESCYSNESSVYSWMFRIEPFTTKYFEMDIEKRSNMFNSIAESYRQATNDPNDFRELIPEFFFFPEFLRNINNIENESVCDVELPKWANNSANEFVYLHRKALESDFVSLHLNEWIDLIWGIKQDGKEAIKAHNNFCPDLYQPSSNENSEHGHIPLKLFDKKHPKKSFNSSLITKSSIKYFNQKYSSHSQASISVDEVDNNVHYSCIKFADIETFISADVTFSPSKKKLDFTFLDSKGNFVLYNLDFNSFESKQFTVKSKNIKKMKIENCESLSFPVFVNNKRFCFIDKTSSSIKVVNCLNGNIEKAIEQTFPVVSIETNQEGLIAVSTEDSTVTVYDIEHLSSLRPPSSRLVLSSPTSSASSLLNSNISLYSNTNSSSLSELSSRFDSTSNSQNIIESTPYIGTLSLFKYSVECIAINPFSDSLVLGTSDNFLLFCRLNLNKMKVNHVVKTDGKPQKIIFTKTFSFFVVSLSRIENGEVIEELVLYSINGEKIRSITLENNKRIVAMTRACSHPGAFDYLIAADNDNNIYVFEAFYLKFGEPIFECKSKINKLTYIHEESLIVAFCEDSTAIVIHYPIID